MRRVLFVASMLSACGGSSYDTTLAIRIGGDASLFTGVTKLELTASRGGQTLAQSTYATTTRNISVANVPFGASTTFTLDGLTTTSDIVAHGSTCSLDFTSQSATSALYFAPTQFFVRTPGAPNAVRTGQMPVALANGDLLLLGGLEGSTATSAAMRYSQASATFSDDTAHVLPQPRAGGETSRFSMGTLLTGGLDEEGMPLSSAALYLSATDALMGVQNDALGARARHRATVISSDRVLLTGGYDATKAALATSAVVLVQSDGTVQVVPGPPLAVPRWGHAALMAVGTPVLIGGYGSDGKPTASIEVLDLADDGDILTFHEVASLSQARAEASATLLGDGSILIAGGIGMDGTPRADAEVYNPIAQTTRTYNMATARAGHTAQLLPNGRVLIVGGTGVGGAPLDDAELFILDVGFVSEHALNDARTGQVVQTLCDGSVLVEGGASTAELYVPAVD